MQKRLHDIGWSDEKSCRSCHKEEVTENHRLNHHQETRFQRDWKWEQRAKTSKEGWTWQKGITSHSLSEG